DALPTTARGGLRDDSARKPGVRLPGGRGPHRRNAGVAQRSARMQAALRFSAGISGRGRRRRPGELAEVSGAGTVEPGETAIASRRRGGAAQTLRTVAGDPRRAGSMVVSETRGGAGGLSPSAAIRPRAGVRGLPAA